MAIQRKQVLAVLTRTRLLEIATVFNLNGLSGKAKGEIIDAIAGARSMALEDLLGMLGRDELQDICRSLEIDDSGREKRVVIQRLLEAAGSRLSSSPEPGSSAEHEGNDFVLLAPQPTVPKPRSAGLSRNSAKAASGNKAGDDTQILSYRHPEKRKNNPEVGMVKPENDPEQPKTPWCDDPHLDPALQFDVGRAQIENLIDNALASRDEAAMRAALEELKRLQQPYLNWSGKAEHTSFEVDRVQVD